MGTGIACANLANLGFFWGKKGERFREAKAKQWDIQTVHPFLHFLPHLLWLGLIMFRQSVTAWGQKTRTQSRQALMSSPSYNTLYLNIYTKTFFFFFLLWKYRGTQQRGYFSIPPVSLFFFLFFFSKFNSCLFWPICAYPHCCFFCVLFKKKPTFVFSFLNLIVCLSALVMLGFWWRSSSSRRGEAWGGLWLSLHGRMNHGLSFSWECLWSK